MSARSLLAMTRILENNGFEHEPPEGGGTASQSGQGAAKYLSPR